MKTYIISEAGVNHNGSLEMAKELVDAAVDAGADGVKFQSFNTRGMISRFARKAAYQTLTTPADESQFEMLQRLELDLSDHRELAAYCGKYKERIEFLSSPFDLKSLDLLISLKVSRLKLPSGEITNAPLLLKAALTGLPLIISTGMSTLGEIETALGVIAFGLLGGQGKPSADSFYAAFASKQGQIKLEEKVTLLHCTTEYPAPVDEVNLKAMDTLAFAFGLPVGYSDHTLGTAVPIAAVARGAVIIEKHFTLDKDLPGPDHKASLTPKEFKTMVKGIREIESAFGSTLKVPAPSEINNRSIVRKSIVAARPIKKGELFTEENLTPKRPGTGVSPMCYWDFLAKRAKRDYSEDEQVE